MREMERTGNGKLTFGNSDKMDVVCHQGVRPNANAVFLRPGLESSKIDEAIRFVMKHGIATDTTVTNVMGILRKDAPTRSGHIK